MNTRALRAGHQAALILLASVVLVAHLPRWLLLALAIVAVLAGVMEVRFLRRRAGSRWWLLVYIALGLAFLLYARRSK